ncbi:Uncharacterised protein [Mycolicibacterium vanbaalenii]|uniref:LPS export ABC transporter periplasmic protein LptC n=1 Tax=Mycolicibacterium vanbaalenii TaxID=110539 RepID=A0A5S9MV91_MYCVN|nr:hypothetical protein [Mycolicibacterium vanbaalenii]CAA0080801.1 Uncharacterised protein [Mycolicibacterium vanbaalenii]
MIRFLRTVCLAVCCAIVVTACGLFFTSEDDPLEAKLATVRDGTQPVPLRELTDFRWDEVHLFNEYTDGAFIEKTVGEPVISADYHAAGSLLVFEETGSVVKTVTVTGDYLRADQPTFSADVLAAPNGSGALRLVSPGRAAPN